MSYAVINVANLAVAKRYKTMPARFEVPHNGKFKRIKSPAELGDEFYIDAVSYRLVELKAINHASPGPEYVYEGSSMDLSGTVLEVTHSWRAKKPEVLDQEREEMEEANATKGLNLPIGRAMFAIANKVRKLEGEPELTPQQFKSWVRSL